MGVRINQLYVQVVGHRASINECGVITAFRPTLCIVVANSSAASLLTFRFLTRCKVLFGLLLVIEMDGEFQSNLRLTSKLCLPISRKLVFTRT